MIRLRRWVLRVLAVVALAGVSYGVVRIVQEGTNDAGAEFAPLEPALKRLSASQAALGGRLERLRPGQGGKQLTVVLRRTQRAQERAVAVLRERQADKLDVPDEDELADALAAEFDYLDALVTVTRKPRSKLLGSVGDRAQAAKDAFTELPDSAGVEDGISGTQAFIAWARSRR